MNNKIKCSIIVVLLIVTFNGFAQQKMSYDEAYRKADELIAKLTLDEKISMTRGYSRFFLNGIPDKGIPYIYLSDATQGVNMRNNLPDPGMVKQLEISTAFPAPIMLAATFNPHLAYQYAQAIGEECRAGGVEFLLGPGINIYRNSQCGRNFEYFGEDPKLTSLITESYVKGMQSTGTAACVKHFIANNTEFYRKRSNSVIDERALNEIYMPGFKSAIDAGVAAVMTSYNQLNGEWCGQSEEVIKGFLRNKFGFRGLVMSDWNSVYDLEKVIRSGQNVEMPGTWDFGISVRELVDKNVVSEKDIEDMIRPILATCISFGLYDREKYVPDLLKKLDEHEHVASVVAAEGTVLLKNNGILPVHNRYIRNILLTGKFIKEIPRGRGSAAVIGYNNINLYDALVATYPGKINYIEKPTDSQLKNADLVIVNVGTVDEEAIERPFNLPWAEESLVKNIVKTNKNTVVLVNSGSGIKMSDWANDAAAILYGWYPGQNGFLAIAKILSGEINPSGKLPMTIEKDFSDSPAANTIPKNGQFYKELKNEQLIKLYDIPYEESIFVGYRWYEAKKIEPLFPFGYGLSYTSFELSKPKISSKTISKNEKVKVAITIQNTGERDGAEVVQLYIKEESPVVLRPIKELKNFQKIYLAKGEKKEIGLQVEYQDLAFWNDKIHDWDVTPGDFKLLLGTSSSDIKYELTLKAK